MGAGVGGGGGGELVGVQGKLLGVNSEHGGVEESLGVKHQLHFQTQ